VTGNSAIVDVRVRELNQLFDTMDPSPFYEQDLAPSAAEYIVDSAKELHVKVPPSVRIHLDNPPPDLNVQATEGAMRAHFARRASHLRRTVRDLLRDGVMSLAIGIAFLALFYTIAQALSGALEDSHWGTLARESLVIGGWVALWRPLEIFLYAWWPIVRERQLHDRLAQLTVTIIASARSS
jgi:hypothetical protein